MAGGKEKIGRTIGFGWYPHPRLRMKQYPFELSGGMRQRVVIAIALACEPNLIVADEPTTALDAAMQVRVIRLLKKIVKETNTALLLVSHNMGVIAAACDYVYVMKDGKMEDQGTREYILHETQNAYTEAFWVPFLPWEVRDMSESKEVILEAKHVTRRFVLQTDGHCLPTTMSI